MATTNNDTRWLLICFTLVCMNNISWNFSATPVPMELTEATVITATQPPPADTAATTISYTPAPMASAVEAEPPAIVPVIPEAERAYIERFQQVAIWEMEKFGIPASIKMAQGLLESDAGASPLARKANNHFGIKCHSRSCRRGHCMNREDDSHKDFFRIYESAWRGWRAHSELLQAQRYKQLYQYGNDYKKWAHGLKAAGYATDARYAEKLINVIERYQLYRLDEGTTIY